MGATGQVGETIFEILNERQFPIKNILGLASSKSLGKTIVCGDKIVKISNYQNLILIVLTLAFFFRRAVTYQKNMFLKPRGFANCVVIDNTSAFRYESNIPLVVPEVNSSDIKHFKKTNIIANLIVPPYKWSSLPKPIHEMYGIKRVNVATYQSVSGSED